MSGQVIHLTYEQAVESARKAVASKPEGFTYEKPEGSQHCMYTAGKGVNEPGCIIGWILFDHGADATWFEGEVGARLDRSGVGYPALSTSVAELIKGGMVTCEDRRTENFLSLLQTKQDNYVPWGTALQESLDATAMVRS